MLNKETLKQMGFIETPASFGLESMKKGIIELKKREDAKLWRVYICSKWVDVKSVDQINILDNCFNKS